ERALLQGALGRAEARSQAAHQIAAQAERHNELSTWLRVWVAARRMALASGSEGGGFLIDTARIRSQTGPAPVRAAAVRYLAAAKALVPAAALKDPDGAVRQAAASAAKDVDVTAARSLVAASPDLDPFTSGLVVSVDKAARNARASSPAGRASVLPALWRDRDGTALLDAARALAAGGAAGNEAIDALAFVDHPIVRASLADLAGDDELPEETKKAAYRALRRNRRREEAALRAHTSPLTLRPESGS
ncbi:MAG TPA: hypothetical protein VGO62_15970, partial [Myxococcota bacterium]